MDPELSDIEILERCIAAYDFMALMEYTNKLATQWCLVEAELQATGDTEERQRVFGEFVELRKQAQVPFREEVAALERLKAHIATQEIDNPTHQKATSAE